MKQEGGRSLLITWGQVSGVAPGVIASVDSRGQNGEQLQHVSYWYAKCGGAHGHSVLSRVIYENEPAPGQTSSAIYTYGMDYGDIPNAASQTNSFPLLKTADDPHFAGAMTKISYKYWGDSCRTQPPHNCGVACMNWPHFTPETIVAERSMDRYSTVVSGFDPVCETGSRKESTGIGGWRWFSFGRHDGTYAYGYELTSETDFYQAGTYPQNPIRRRQDGAEPGTVWDGRGILAQMDWADDSGSPSEIQYVDGSTCTYDRNPPSGAPALDSSMHNARRHWLFKKKDERGQWTIYTRDSRRRVTRIDYPDNSFETYTYNGFNQVETHTLPNLNIQHFQYDGSQRLIMAYNEWDYNRSNLDYTDYTYYGPGDHPEWADLVKTMKDGRARAAGAPFTARMTYNGRHQVLSVEYAALAGQSIPTVHYEYDNYGNCTAIIDELGHRNDYLYDAYRRCTSLTEQVNACGVAGRRWDWIYDRVMDYSPATTLSSSAHTSKEWRMQIEPAYDANGRRRGTDRVFDVNNRIVAERTGLFQASGAPLGTLQQGDDTETHHFTYDPNGQKSSYTDPRQRLTTYEYDNRNRLWKSTENPMPGSTGTPRTTETLYNAAGGKTQVTFPDGKYQQWPDSGYTAFGQPRVFINERFQTTNLEYKPWGPMKKLAEVVTHREMDGGGQEDQQTTFDYDGMGRLLTTHFPDHLSSEVTTYEFGQVKTYQTRRQATKTISYDARGRETVHTWNDNMTSGVSRIWDDGNRLMRISNNISTIDYTYDAADQMLTESTSVAGSGGQTPLGTAVSRQVGYCRYPSGEVSQVTYPNGSIVVNRNYTARGQVAGVGWNTGSTSYTYLADGKVSGQFRSNGISTTFGYDGRGMISSVRHTKDSNNHDLAKRDYWRDDRDRITAWKRGVDTYYSGMEDGRGNRYHYDDEGELDLADYRAQINVETGEVSDPKRRDQFSYDALGNRAGGSHSASLGDVNFNRRDNGLNQYLNWTQAAIYYDDNFGSPWVPPGNGVTMAEGWITASFNALNQPMAMWCPTYGSNFKWFGFDPLGRCVKRWDGPLAGTPPNQHAPPLNSNQATYYYYDGWNLVQEGSNGSIADRTYVHGSRVDEILASQVDGLWYYHHYDGSGNCIMLTNTAGGLQEQYDYDAFGLPYFNTTTGGKFTSPPHTRFLFTGREWLSDLRIYDYRARQYQPELGRFLQPDPQEFSAGDYNLYRYCHNDPANKSDPMGLEDPTWDRLMLWQRGGNGTVTEQLITKRATAALDEAAGWASRHKMEVAGTINSKGLVIPGPENERTALTSNPGITDDTVATWHIHVPGVPGALRGAEYRFSNQLGPSDSNMLRRHPDMMHYVGVLDGAPGKFTIFGYMSPERPYEYIRANYGVTPGFGCPDR